MKETSEAITQPCPYLHCDETVIKTVDQDSTPLYLNLDGERHTCQTVEEEIAALILLTVGGVENNGEIYTLERRS